MFSFFRQFKNTGDLDHLPFRRQLVQITFLFHDEFDPLCAALRVVLYGHRVIILVRETVERSRVDPP